MSTYARLNADKTEIVEYPVYSIHITNRAEPVEWYTPVIYDPKPLVPDFHYAKETQTIIDDGAAVRVSFEIVAQTLQELLSFVTNRTSFVLPGQETAVNIADVDPALVARIVDLTKVHVQAKLDALAQAEGYDSIMSAASYSMSSVPEYASDAVVANHLRDTVWPALYSYLTNVQAGTEVIPKTVADIEAQLPSLVWTAV